MDQKFLRSFLFLTSHWSCKVGLKIPSSSTPPPIAGIIPSCWLEFVKSSSNVARAWISNIKLKNSLLAYSSLRQSGPRPATAWHRDRVRLSHGIAMPIWSGRGSFQRCKDSSMGPLFIRSSKDGNRASLTRSGGSSRGVPNSSSRARVLRWAGPSALQLPHSPARMALAGTEIPIHLNGKEVLVSPTPSVLSSPSICRPPQTLLHQLSLTAKIGRLLNES